mgnify:FL=1
MSEELINQVKNIFIFALTAILSIITTAQGAIITLLFGFVFNFFIGMNADRVQHQKDFSMKKATESVKLFMFYIITIFFIFAVLHKNIDFANDVVNWLTYIVCYFYATNIFRNAKICFPQSKSISFIYHLLSTEIFTGMKKLISQKIGINIDENDKNNG